MARSPNEPVGRRRRTRPNQSRVYTEAGTLSGYIEDGSGGQIWDGEGEPPGQTQDTATPGIVKRVVTAGTATPADGSVVAIALNTPPGFDTWYLPRAGYASPRWDAAIQTIADTGARITDAGERLLDVGGAVLGNMKPILIGAAILYVWLQWEKMK